MRTRTCPTSPTLPRGLLDLCGAKAAAKGLGIEPAADWREIEALGLRTVETIPPRVEAITPGFKRLGALVDRHEVALRKATGPVLTVEGWSFLVEYHHHVRPQVGTEKGSSSRSAHGQPRDHAGADRSSMA